MAATFILLGNGSDIPEYNGFNTKLARETGVGLHPATHVCFYVINMNPAEPETMLTIMNLVKSQNKQGKSIECLQTIKNYSK